MKETHVTKQLFGTTEDSGKFTTCSIQPSLNYEREEFTTKLLGKEFNNFI